MITFNKIVTFLSYLVRFFNLFCPTLSSSSNFSVLLCPLFYNFLSCFVLFFKINCCPTLSSFFKPFYPTFRKSIIVTLTLTKSLSVYEYIVFSIIIYTFLCLYTFSILNLMLLHAVYPRVLRRIAFCSFVISEFENPLDRISAQTHAIFMVPSAILDPPF